jgi:hypothetical protein
MTADFPQNRLRITLTLLALCLVGIGSSTAQLRVEHGDVFLSSLPITSHFSGKKAFLLSIALPGLGHRYVNSGKWDGWGAAFSLADAGLWISLFGGEWRRDQLVESYTTLAASKAGADVAGKNRVFFLNLASFRSSDDFLDTVLRNRAWDQISYVAEQSFQWNWESKEDFERFRSLRSDAESLSRRSTVLIAALVANRLISGILASQRAGKMNRMVKFAFGAPGKNSITPTANLSITY